METEDIAKTYPSAPYPYKKRDCSVLVPAADHEEVVAYWRPAEGTILRLHTGVLLPSCPGWLELGRRGGSMVVLSGIKEQTLPGAGTPLASLTADSYPHSEEDWDAIAPPGYGQWLAATPQQARQPVMDAWREYEEFYQENQPFQTSDRPVFAVVGGWGFIFVRASGPTIRTRPAFFSLSPTPSHTSRCAAPVTANSF